MAWFGRPAHGERDALPLALFPEPCTLRGQVGEVLDASGIAWRVAYESSELIGLRSAAKAGLGMTCLVANGDELWGLTPSVRPGLPEPPEPLPVTMALAPGAVPEAFAGIAEKAFRQALQGYPLSSSDAGAKTGTEAKVGTGATAKAETSAKARADAKAEAGEASGDPAGAPTSHTPVLAAAAA